MLLDVSEPAFHGLVAQYLEDAHPDEISKLVFTAMDALNDWDGDEVIEIFDRIGRIANKEAKYLREREL